MKIDYQVIERFLDGKGTDDEKSQIINWFKDLTVEEGLREKSMRYWVNMPENILDDQYNESVVLGRIYRNIKLYESIKENKAKRLVRFTAVITRVAAVLFIPLLILFISKNKIREIPESEVVYTEIYSPLSSRTMFYLPDGSKGWLNGGSYLKYEEGFPNKIRSVSLRGEAFFNIKTNPKRPFVVYCKDFHIMAKGTSFNVLSWDEMPEIEITLVEGKIDVSANFKEGKKRICSLLPGELLHCQSGIAESYIQKVDVDKHIAWIKGKLVFRDDSFSDVVSRLNRWYNVNIIIKDETLESYKYVATFQDETLDEVLKMLAISAPLSYRNFPRAQLSDGTFEKRKIELYYNPYKKIKKSNPMSN